MLPEGKRYVPWEIDELEIEEGISLWFQGNKLTNNDGVFELRTELVKFLSDQGYKMTWALAFKYSAIEAS